MARWLAARRGRPLAEDRYQLTSQAADGNSMNSIRRAVYGGVLFGVAVLALIYYVNTRSRADKARPGVDPSAETQATEAEHQAAVVEALRGKRADVQVEILQWWPPKLIAMDGPERLLCRAIYRLTVGESRTVRDGVFDVGRGGVRPVQDEPESVQTHSKFDRYFP